MCSDFIDPSMTLPPTTPTTPAVTNPLTTPVTSLCLTSPGNNVDGAPCAFPFTYLGVSRTTCIVGGGRQFPWCSLTTDYDDVGLWGSCTGELSVSTIVTLHEMFNTMFRQTIKYHSSALLTPCEVNPLMTGGFRSQRVSNAESCSMTWRHHVSALNLRALKC